VSLRDADIRGKHGLNVLAVRADAAAAWEYNPAPDRALAVGTTVVVLGSSAQVRDLKSRAES
jgi:uncharacterized protein with PhoU and TrkA domain